MAGPLGAERILRDLRLDLKEAALLGFRPPEVVHDLNQRYVFGICRLLSQALFEHFEFEAFERPVALTFKNLPEHAVGPGDLVAQDRVRVIVMLGARQDRKAAVVTVRDMVQDQLIELAC